MPFVLVAVSEKVAMKLPDMVLGDLDVRPMASIPPRKGIG
jgi:hypothetical protein